MKICLIGYYDDGQLGLRSLEATLEEAGHEVFLVFLKDYSNSFIPPTETEYSLLENFVGHLNPDLIGITVRSPMVWLAIGITERLRKFGAPIVWGGIHTTSAPEYAIKVPDMLLRGESDVTFPKLADALSKGGDFSEIPGLWWKENGEVRNNPLGDVVRDLDSLPPLILREENRRQIESNQIIEGDPLGRTGHFSFPVMASRGCPQQCTYCANATIIGLYGKQAQKLRVRSPERIAAEVNAFKDKYGPIGHAAFMDEVFNYDSEWNERFCEVWKKEVNDPFTIITYPTLVKEEQIKQLKDVGLFFVNIGVQSGSERIRREVYRRAVSNENILKSAQILKNNGVDYRVEFIYGNPLDEVEDLKETLDLMMKLPRPHVTTRYQLTYFPGTPLTKRFLKEGIITRDQVQGYSEGRTTTWAISIDITDGHSPEFYFYLCLLAIIEFRWYWREPDHIMPQPHFYPRWFVRWMEKRTWLRNNFRAMVSLTDRLGKFAHWSFYWTYYIPQKLASKIKTALRLLFAGDWQSIKAGLKNFGRRVAKQLGFNPAD